MKPAVLIALVVGILAVLAVLLVIGLTEGDDTDMEQEEDRQDGAPALVQAQRERVGPASAVVLR
jgi:hypothetical protein